MQTTYQHSIANPAAYWEKIAQQFYWRAPWHTVKNTRFTGDVSIRWFEGAQLNITENAIDRHLPQLADKTAIIWEGDDAKNIRHISFQELHDEVCRTANALKAMGVKRGDVVTIYMPMVPEAAFAMLACARIGAVHSVVFAGFAPDSIRARMEDCASRFIITADEVMRGGKAIALKSQVDAAVESSSRARHGISASQGAEHTEIPAFAGMTGDAVRTLVYRHTGAEISMQSGRDVWWHDMVPQQSPVCEAESMEAEDPLFVLYTSGSTGKPKGLLHSCGGYMVYAAHTHKTTFNIQPDSVFWCSADVGWITGHSYVVYGPLINGCTTVMFEGVPTHPTPSRFWQVIDRHGVTEFYTAPTAIRALMRFGDAPVKATSRNSLRVLGSVGEPINPEAWNWYHDVVGESRCAVIDSWWQTETGGHMITPIAGVTPTKPGSATLPFYGIQPALYGTSGERIEGAGEGLLCIDDSWPGQARSIWGDHARFVQTYFSNVAGKYFSGDGARRDADGYYWITGRVDDVINVSGHRLGTAEIESALVAHTHVAEAAVVGFPHDIKGQGIYAFVTLNEGVEASAALEKELALHVRAFIGALATPDVIHLTPGLPKTRSGKIMRRILRKIAEGDTDNLGDISTLLNPEVVADLVR
jgi:acetyl-CoA synthetase